MTITVRRAAGNDLGDVVEVGRQAWLDTHAGLYEPEVRDLFVDRLWSPAACADGIRAGRTFVAEDAGGRVVGMAAYGYDRGEVVLWRIYVRPDSQGRGIGAALLTAVADDLPARESLQVSYVAGNAAAARFAEHHGFVEIRRDPQSPGLPDLVWLSRPLHDTSAQAETTTDASTTTGDPA